MKTNKNLLDILLNNVIDFTTDLLELGYTLNDSLKYGLSFIYNQKNESQLSTADYIQLECNYIERIAAVS